MAFFDFLHIFTDLFNSAEKAWHKLEPQVQSALVDGSDIIGQKFPKLSKEKLAAGLAKVNDGLKIAQGTENPDLLTTIKDLQAYLSGLQGKFWESASSIAAQVLSTVFSPDETPFAKISMLIEYVYRKKIKE